MKETLTAFNLFVQGRGHQGDVTELSLPKIASKMVPYQAGGMDGPVKVEMGMEEMMLSCTLVSHSNNPDVRWGLAAGVGNTQISVRGSVRREADGTEFPLRYTCRGQVVEIDDGTWKRGAATEKKYKMELSYYKYERDGVSVIEIDLLNGIKVIDGVDQLEASRANTGI